MKSCMKKCCGAAAIFTAAKAMEVDADNEIELFADNEIELLADIDIEHPGPPGHRHNCSHCGGKGCARFRSGYGE